MRIAILVPNFVEFDGGAQNARVQAEHLVEEGHQVAVFTFAADIKLKNAGVFVMGMPRSLFWERIYRLFFPLDIFKALRWLPKIKDFDHVIVHLYPLTWIAYLAKKLYKVKYTFVYHGIMDPKLLPHFHEKVYMWAQILLTRFTIQSADEAIAVSAFAQKELKRYTGVDSKVVYGPYDKTRFNPSLDGGRVREELKLGDAPVILSVGAIRPVKGFHLLVKAFKSVKQQLPEARLIIVGKHSFDYYSKQVKADSDDSTLFIDCIPNGALPPYYAACDVYATCSLWETFNIPLAEAQLCGKPAVVFDIGPHPEVISKKGVLVEAGNIDKFVQACVEKLKQARGM
jgi:glycosyltransferase involved in cell wall biosynthesis